MNLVACRNQRNLSERSPKHALHFFKIVEFKNVIFISCNLKIVKCLKHMFRKNILAIKN